MYLVDEHHEPNFCEMVSRKRLFKMNGDALYNEFGSVESKAMIIRYQNWIM